MRQQRVSAGTLCAWLVLVTTAAQAAPPKTRPALAVTPMLGPYRGIWDFCTRRALEIGRRADAALLGAGFMCSTSVNPFRATAEKPAGNAPPISGRSYLRDVPGCSFRKVIALKFIPDAGYGEESQYLLALQTEKAWFVYAFEVEAEGGWLDGYGAGDPTEEARGFLVSEELACRDLLADRRTEVSLKYSRIDRRRVRRPGRTEERRVQKQVVCALGASGKPSCMVIPLSGRTSSKACWAVGCSAATSTADWAVSARFARNRVIVTRIKGAVPAEWAGAVADHPIVLP